MFTSTPVPTRAKPKFSSTSGSNLPQKIKDIFRTTETSSLIAGLNKKWAWVSTKKTILLWNHGKDQASSHAPLVFRLPPTRSEADIEWNCFVISAGRTQVESLLAISTEGSVVWFPTLVPENRFDTTSLDLQQNETITAMSFAEAPTGAHAVVGTSQSRILVVTVPLKKTSDDFVKVSVARQSKGPQAGWNFFSRFWGNSAADPIRACRLAPNGLVYGLTASSLVSSDGQEFELVAEVARQNAELAADWELVDFVISERQHIYILVAGHLTEAPEGFDLQCIFHLIAFSPQEQKFDEAEVEYRPLFENGQAPKCSMHPGDKNSVWLVWKDLWIHFSKFPNGSDPVSLRKFSVASSDEIVASSVADNRLLLLTSVSGILSPPPPQLSLASVVPVTPLPASANAAAMGAAGAAKDLATTFQLYLAQQKTIGDAKDLFQSFQEPQIKAGLLTLVNAKLETNPNWAEWAEKTTPFLIRDHLMQKRERWDRLALFITECRGSDQWLREGDVASLFTALQQRTQAALNLREFHNSLKADDEMVDWLLRLMHNCLLRGEVGAKEARNPQEDFYAKVSEIERILVELEADLQVRFKQRPPGNEELDWLMLRQLDFANKIFVEVLKPLQPLAAFSNPSLPALLHRYLTLLFELIADLPAPFQIPFEFFHPLSRLVLKYIEAGTGEAGQAAAFVKPFVVLGQLELALELAEAAQDLQLMVEVCLRDEEKFSRRLQEFSRNVPGFASVYFGRLGDDRPKLLTLPDSYNEALTPCLKDELAWVHAVRCGDWRASCQTLLAGCRNEPSQAKPLLDRLKIMLSLAKISLLAAGTGQAVQQSPEFQEVEQRLFVLETQLEFEPQETYVLTVPELADRLLQRSLQKPDPELFEAASDLLVRTTQILSGDALHQLQLAIWKTAFLSLGWDKLLAETTLGGGHCCGLTGASLGTCLYFSLCTLADPGREKSIYKAAFPVPSEANPAQSQRKDPDLMQYFVNSFLNKLSNDQEPPDEEVMDAIKASLSPHNTELKPYFERAWDEVESRLAADRMQV